VVLGVGLPGTRTTVSLCLSRIVPPHSGHSLIAGTFVTLAPASRLDKRGVGSYR